VRINKANRCALAALAAAETDASSVLAVGVGAAAPIDAEGRTVPGNEFWSMINVDLRHAFAERHGWPVIVDNDANLAALAERWRGSCRDVQNFAVILAGERLGAGLVEGGRLLHGVRGGAGEFAFLHFVEGVGDASGFGLLAREWGRDAVRGTGATGVLVDLAGANPGALSAEMVFSAATQGDPLAVDILDRIGERFARIIGAVASLLNPEIVVIGGAVAGASRYIIPTIEAELPRFTDVPPRVLASELGQEVVSLGAVRTALDHAEAHALDPTPV
jgi:predicted NBD/HSP70 family sugar kinase